MEHALSTPPPATQAPPKMGHNNPPRKLFGIGSAWLHFANAIELRRLSKLHLRIERKEAALRVLIGERQLIMNRCIRRMRRNSGKN